MLRPASRWTRLLPATALAAGLIAGCQGQQTPDEPPAPPLAQATSSTTPQPAAPRAEPLPEACGLIPAARIGAAFDRPDPEATEDETVAATGNARSCRYQFEGPVWVQLVYADPISSGSAEQVVNQAMLTYSGELERLTDVGEAAVYSSDGSLSTLISARTTEAPLMVTVSAFVPGDHKEPLAAVAREVLEHV